MRFAIQFGEGSLDGSSDYYEWSFRPTKYNCTSGDRPQDCHEENWLSNAFAMDLSDFSDMKRGRKPPFLEPTVRKVEGSSREEQLRLVGNPSVTLCYYRRCRCLCCRLEGYLLD